MSGFSVEGGKITITNGARTVTTTDGTLVNLLPAAYDVSLAASVAYADFPKDYAYNWWFTVQRGTGSNWGLDEGCRTTLTIPPLEFAQESVLMAVPAGVDFFLSRVRLNRTVAPNRNWAGSPVTPLPVMGQWIPFSGSILMEAELGIARAMSIYISGGNLILHRQQSVGPPAGGYGLYGSAAEGFGARTGGEWLVSSAQGIPVLLLDTRDTSPAISTNSFPNQQYRRGNVNQCVMSDPGASYASTYSVEIQGAFGRRS